MANAAVKQDPAALVAEAITDPQRAADAAATVTEPRPGETKGDYVRRMRQERGLSAKPPPASRPNRQPRPRTIRGRSAT